MHTSTFLRHIGASALLLATSATEASHLCGAEIFYDHVSGFTYDLELHIYAGSTINPTSYNMEMGDGSMALITLATIDTFPSFCCAYRLVYTGQHTYATTGQYPLSIELTTRSPDVLNIPSPTNQSICARGLINIPNTNSYNSSARFTAPQTYTYFIGNTFIHEVNAVDADGDSLVFSMGVPSGNFCNVMLGYDEPHEVSPPGDTSWVDVGTGIFRFQDPFIIGSYVILINVDEYRNGALVGRVQRDMKFCLNSTTDAPSVGPPSTPALLPGAAPGLYLLQHPSQTVRYTVLDANGRVVQRNTVPAGGLFDFRSFAPGLYTLATDDGTVTERFVVAR